MAFRWSALFFLFAILCGGVVRAQEPVLNAAIPSTEAIQKAAEKAKNNETLDDATKEAITKRYEEIRQRIEVITRFRKAEELTKRDLEKGPTELASMREELDRRKQGVLPPPPKDAPELSAAASPEEIDARLTAERARIADLTRQIRDRKAEIASIETRPIENRDRSIALAALISDAEAAQDKWDAASPTAPKDLVDLSYDKVNLTALHAEQSALEQEGLAINIRRDLLKARADLASSDLDLARQRVAKLESRRAAIVTARIDEAEDLLSELGLHTSGEDDPEIRRILDEIHTLGDANTALQARITRADEEFSKAGSELDRLRRDGENLRAQIRLGGLEKSLAEIVFDLHRMLPTPESLRTAIQERRTESSRARLEVLRLDREMEALPSESGQIEEILELLRHQGVEEDALKLKRASVAKFVSNRMKLRKEVIDANDRLATLLGEIDLITSETLIVSGELRDFLGERLVWTASSPPLGKTAFMGLRSSVVALAGPEAFREYGQAILRIPWPLWVMAVILATALLLPRRRLRLFLAASAGRTRRISTDSVKNTLEALAASVWLALPLPVLMWFFGWAFLRDPQGNPVVFALGKGLMAPALLLLVLRFTWVLCWKDGVGEAHFRWPRTILDPLKRALVSLLVVYFPAHAVLAIWWFSEGDLAAFQGPGRLVFIAAMISLIWVLRRFFRESSSSGTKSNGRKIRSEKTHSLIQQLRWLWMAALLVFPAGFAVLAALGHFLTAVMLSYLLQKTLIVILGGVLVDSLLTRWAALKARRMALADALAQRETRRAAQEEAESGKEEGGPSAADESFIPTEEDVAVDWTLVSEQTGNLIRALVILLVLFGCWLAWSEVLPTLKYLDRRELFAGITLITLIRLMILGTVTTVIFQNLPGLMELGFLRALDLDAGVRNAVVTLAQYAVVAVATVITFRMLGLDWSQFSWIAAALSVGLGFGLQEVVANFVSGLILLFERPIRLGDLVTVDGVDGVVTKIRIRATTITNSDKKEFIVPNKEFITGTILNWTLSNRDSRLVFTIGIAYDSDVAKAREILLEIACSQPEILTDPAPGAVFYRFAESNLELRLHCFVSGPEYRAEMTNRINSLILRRFSEAGIEMPFPQSDVHLRMEPSPIHVRIEE